MMEETPRATQATDFLDVVPLNRAILCANCEMISAAPGHCPVCGSAAVLNLAKILNREEKQETVNGTRTDHF